MDCSRHAPTDHPPTHARTVEGAERQHGVAHDKDEEVGGGQVPTRIKNIVGELLERPGGAAVLDLPHPEHGHEEDGGQREEEVVVLRHGEPPGPAAVPPDAAARLVVGGRAVVCVLHKIGI